MKTGNENGAYGVTSEKLGGLYEAHVAETLRKRAEEQAREEWPANVNALLQLLVGKVTDLQRRVADLEAGRG